MTDIPNWDTVTPEVKPIATDYLNELKDTFENAGYEVSEIGDRDEAGGIAWDITITTADEVIVVSYKIVDSLEYEGEMLGYNVSVNAVTQDGRVLVKHTPHNYTDRVWTTDLEELTRRAENIPKITPDDL